MRTAEVVECARGMSIAEDEVRRWRACAGSVYVANVVASEVGWILNIGRLPWLGCARWLRED